MDNKQQKNLVDELAQHNQVLFATYKKTEEVAINHWYPGMAQTNGSFNSYPHVQGVIHQLSIVVYHPQCAITLTDVELYLLLTSILLHDIGKIKQKKNHGEVSRDLIKEHWAELKIENEQIQYIIQNICFLHDRSEEDFVGVYQQLPADEYIDRYGKVRPRLLGALLYLGDRMDNSYTRTLPEELTNHFRKNVLGVHFLPEQQLITTVIHPEAFLQNMLKKENAPCYPDLVKESLGTLRSFIENEIKEPTDHSDVKQYVDSKALLYLVRDTHENDQCLRNIRNELYMLGMPIKKWMIECKGQLFLIQKHNHRSTDQSINYSTLESLISILEEDQKSGKTNADKGRLRNELVALLEQMDTQPNKRGQYLPAIWDATLKLQPLLTNQKNAPNLAQEPGADTLKRQESKEALHDIYQLFQICQLYAIKKEEDLAQEVTLTPYYHAVLSVEPLTGFDYCMKVLTAMYDMTSTIFAKSFYTFTDICNYMREDPKNTRKVMSAVRRLSYLFQFFQGSEETAAARKYEIYYNDQSWNITNAKEISETQVCYIKPTPDGEPQSILNKKREQHVIEDWTEEER